MSARPLFSARRLLAFTWALLFATSVPAQLVNDGASLTLINQTNTFTGDVTVGTNGAFTLLVLSDNALLTNSANGVISRNATARSNEVRLVSATARWLMNGVLYVGSNGANASIVVSNGAFVSDGAAIIGNLAASSNNLALITGGGSLWTNRNGLDIGGLGRGNQMIVSNGGWVVSKTARLGVDASGTNNFVLVTGSGSVWSNALNLSVGNIGPGNRLVIEAGGLVNDDIGLVGDFNSASNNEVLVTGPDSLWINRSSLTIGSQMPRNRLVVSNGAAVWSGNTTIGSFGSLGNNNSVLLTDVGTLWSNQNDLVVGNTSFGNQLVVSNGAMIVSSNVFVGFGATSTNNRVVVDGGVLLLTNAVGNGTLDVRRGTNVIDAGLVEVDQLLVTNTSGRFEFNGGTLAVNQSTINNGQLFRVGNGVSAASFDLVGIGTHTFANGLTISANVTINMEIGKNGSVVTNNQIIVSGPLTYGGTLIVSNLGPTTLVGGDRFKLFDATSTSIAGSFSSITLPPLDPLFVWTNKLLVDGSIEVTPVPGFTYLKASNTGTNDVFGVSVAVSGDTLVIGAESEASNATGVNGNQTNNSAVGSGAAYVFVRNGTTWTQQAYLKASNTGAGDLFGGSVAISGDTIVISAEREASSATGVNSNQSDNSATGSGAAYVFVRSGTNWTQQAYLKASNTGLFDGFGFAVALSGDTVVVGAGGEDSNATGVNGNQSDNSAFNSGAAYVFVRNGTNWTQQAYLKASDTAANDLFGDAVAVSGDTVVVGSELNSSIVTNSGAAYVFVRNGTNWVQQASLKASNAGADDEFGHRNSVAMDGDTIVVAATDEDSAATGVNGNGIDNSATNSGAAYVFVRNGTNWTQQAYLKASNTEADDSFGLSAVAISGDTVVVGAGYEDSSATGLNGDGSSNSATNSGAAYVFVRNGTNWSQQYYVKATNTDPDDRFGIAVAVSGRTIVAGAYAERSAATGVNGDESDNSVFGTGATYVFDLSLLSPPVLGIAPNGLNQVTLSWSPPTPGFALQESLSLAPVSWSNSPSGETNPITLPASGSTRFFRLFKP